MIVFDTTVLVYAVGVEHPLREDARRLLAAVAAGSIAATTTVKVIQEFAHVRSRRRGRSDAAALARQQARLLAPLLTSRQDDLERGLELFEQERELGAFDAVLAATAIAAGAQALVSSDAAFGSVGGLPFVRLGTPEVEELLPSAG